MVEGSVTVSMDWTSRGPRLRVRQGADVVSVVGGVTTAFSVGERLDVGEEEDIVEESSVDEEHDDVDEDDRHYSLAILLMVDMLVLSADFCAGVRSATVAELVITGSSIAASANFSRSNVTTSVSSGFLTYDFLSSCGFVLSGSRLESSEG